MEDTYNDFIRHAQESVKSTYAKQLLAKIRDKTLDSDALLNADVWDIRTVLQLPSWVHSAAVLLCILILSNFLYEHLKNTAIYGVIRHVLLILIALTVFVPIYTFLQDAQIFMHDLSLFLGALIPTIGVLAASGGNIALANAGNTLLPFFLSAVQICLNVLLPSITSLFFGFVVVDVFSGERKMQPLSKFVRNTLFSLLSIFTAIILIILSVQSVAAMSTDTVSARTLRLLISNAIPIVGGTIGDALKLVGGGLVTVKNAVGTGAVAFLLALYLPVLLTAWCNSIFLNLFGVCCEYFGFTEVEGLLTHLKCAIEFSMAVFSIIFVFGIVNIGIFMHALPVVIS